MTKVRFIADCVVAIPAQGVNISVKKGMTATLVPNSKNYLEYSKTNTYEATLNTGAIIVFVEHAVEFYNEATGIWETVKDWATRLFNWIRSNPFKRKK